MIHFKLLDETAEDAWDGVAANSAAGTVFHTWAWMRVIEKLKGAEKLPYGIFHRNELIGVFPLFRVRYGPMTVLASPLGGVGYGGLLVDRARHRAVIEHLDSLLQSLDADYIELRASDTWAQSAWATAQYTVKELQTYVLPLNQDPEEAWSNLKKECRTAVRKARKNDVEIGEATDKGFLDTYFEMVKETFSKSKRPPPLSQQDYGFVWDVLKPYDRIKVLLARHENQVVAGGIFLRFSDKIYYWDGASFPAYYSLNANNLLHWTLIEWGANNGLRQYDMMGANIPGIARFKKSFGGELQSYIYAYKTVTWRADLGRRFYQWIMPKMRRAQAMLRPA
jgi:predicted N-acyltransferase